jgi:hypothetical protein
VHDIKDKVIQKIKSKQMIMSIKEVFQIFQILSQILFHILDLFQISTDRHFHIIPHIHISLNNYLNEPIANFSYIDYDGQSFSNTSCIVYMLRLQIVSIFSFKILRGDHLSLKIAVIFYAP